MDSQIAQKQNVIEENQDTRRHLLRSRPPTTQKERERERVCVCVLHDKMFSRVLPVSTHTLDRGSTAGFPVPPAIFLTLSGKAFPSVSSAGGPMTLRKSSTSHTEWTR